MNSEFVKEKKNLMINYMIYMPNGKITQFGTILEDSIETFKTLLSNEESLLIVDELLDINKVYYDISSNTIKLIPEKPNNYVEFDYDVKDWITDYDFAWEMIRRQRNILLSNCDWTQLSDIYLSISQQVAWKDYRKTLRDLPQVQTDPLNIIWPVAPNVNTPLVGQ